MASSPSTPYQKLNYCADIPKYADDQSTPPIHIQPKPIYQRPTKRTIKLKLHIPSTPRHKGTSTQEYLPEEIVGTSRS